MRIKAEQVELQKEEIIKQATIIFGKKGYAATNMADIVKEMGISRTPLYYHFGNKELLFTAVFERHADFLYSTTQMIYDRDNSFFDNLQSELEAIALESSGVYGEHIRSEVRANREIMPELYEKLKKLNSDIYKIKMKAIKKAIEKKELASDVDVQYLVSLIYIFYYGLSSESTKLFMKDNKQNIKDAIAAFVDLFKHRYSIEN